jgi:hypothetical protein
MNLRPLVLLLLILLVTTNAAVSAQPKRSTPIFVYSTDEVWLNLHHFLHALGRAENKDQLSSRAAISGAPGEQERGLATVSDAEKLIWRKAVSDYAAGPAKKDTVWDEQLAATTKALGLAGGAKTLKNASIDPAYVDILERAAPIYRKVWWKQHLEANRRWQKLMDPLVEKYGPGMLTFITKAYQLEWPAAGYPIHVSSYADWAGAYSTTGNLLVLSSQDSGLQAAYGLETIFHEAMHQWDSQVFELVRTEARKQGKRFPGNITHSLIWVTAGEAMKLAFPDHVPYADKFGIWQRGLKALEAPVKETWTPHLEGRTTREEALAELIKRIGT